MTNKPGDLWMLNGKVHIEKTFVDGKYQPAVREYRSALLDEYGNEAQSDGWWTVAAGTRTDAIAAANAQGYSGEPDDLHAGHATQTIGADLEASSLLTQAMHAINAREGQADPLPPGTSTPAPDYSTAPAMQAGEDDQATNLLREAMKAKQPHTHQWLSMSEHYSRASFAR